jgi:hypothetical protein
MEKISMDKSYRTRCGLPVRILCVDRLAEGTDASVIALVRAEDHEVIKVFNNQGFNLDDKSFDLMEYDPLADLKVDDPLWVRDSPLEEWLPRHFAFHKNGRIYCWPEGRTSWSVEISETGDREEPIGWSLWKKKGER